MQMHEDSVVGSAEVLLQNTCQEFRMARWRLEAYPRVSLVAMEILWFAGGANSRQLILNTIQIKA